MSDVDEPSETVKMLRQALRVKLKQDLPNLITLPKGQIRVASTKTGFRCEVCYKWFQARTTLAMHRKKAHKNAPTPSLVRERAGNFFVCPLCFDPQHSKGIYEHHLKMEHDQALETQRFIVDSMEGVLNYLYYIFRYLPNLLQNLRNGRKRWKKIPIVAF